MNIQQLIASSAEIYSSGILARGEESHYSSAYTFSHKEFGQVLQYNKTVIYKPNYDIVEIGLFITAKTEKGKTGHFCQCALKGVDMKPVSKNEIFKRVRERQGGKLSNYSDAEIIDYVERGGTVYNGKYVVRSRRDDDMFLVMNKRISPDTEVRVRCSCASFFFDIAWYNGTHNCLIGAKPPAYPKFKMDPTAKPIRNVYKKPGLCKHLMLLFSMLMKDDFIVGGTDDPNGIKESSFSIFNKKKNQERISTSRANYYIEQTMKEVKAQRKASNLIAQAQVSETPKKILSKVRMKNVKGVSIKKYLNNLRNIPKASNPAQRQKNISKRRKSDTGDDWGIT